MLSVVSPRPAGAGAAASAPAHRSAAPAAVTRSTATWSPTIVDMRRVTAEELAEAIKADATSVLILTNVGTAAPFGAIADLFARVTPELGRRANAAVAARGDHAGMRLVWKDAHGDGRGGPRVDDKRVIDLSPSRVAQVRAADPALSAALGASLEASLAFFERATAGMVPLLVGALRAATGCGDYSVGEARVSWRMVEHKQRVVPIVAAATAAASATDADAGAEGGCCPSPPPPRCSAHRDFGTATLIYASGPGLEARVGGEWRAVPAPPADACVLLFGLCTAWRSNDRVRAAEHRVSDAVAAAAPAAAEGDGGKDDVVVSPGRLSAVLFLGLCDDAPLRPAVLAGEPGPRYVAERCGNVHPVVRRKWSEREGSVTAEERAAEERERALYPTQEALIAAKYKTCLR